LPYLWPNAGWPPAQVERIDMFLARLPAEAPFELTMAILLADRPSGDIERIARDLTLSNEQREMTTWLVAHQADLDDPARPSLAELKRLMAHPAFGALRRLMPARYEDLPDGAARRVTLDARLCAIAPDAVQPEPFVKGDDLLQRGVAPGPAYKEILDALYARQLDEVIRSRDEGLAALEALLKERSR
jgi:poly(A) polymerase